MSTEVGFKLVPALVAGARGSLVGVPGRTPTALALTPIYDLETSSRPMMLPPFVVRLTNPSTLVSYPSFPSTE